MTPLDDAAWLDHLRGLYREGRHAEGAAQSEAALARHPAVAELWNIRGVFLRKLGHGEEALAALDEALALKPDVAGARINRGNVLLDLGETGRAAAAFAEVVEADPGNPTHLHLLASALARDGQTALAVARFRQLLALKPDDLEAWIHLSAVLQDNHRPAEAEAVLERALERHPDAESLLRAKAAFLRASNQLAQAEALLTGLGERLPERAWILFHLGDLVWESDHDRGEALIRRAQALEPESLDYRMGLIQALERRMDEGEGERLDETYRLALDAQGLGAATPGAAKVMRDVFDRVCDFEALERLGDMRQLGRAWARAGTDTAFLRQLSRVRDGEDRREGFLAQHRLWGEAVEQTAARAPVRRSSPPRGGRIRLGVMSSDLRNHVVGHFAQPIFDHVDAERFEVFAYSFSRAHVGEAQARVAGQVAAFRWRPHISARDAAQMIADDALDVLVELGGSTNMNKLEVMAWKPAPVQASWLGYPHSAGLSTIDYFICDPFNQPAAPGLLIEKPLVMPHSWVSLGPAAAQDLPIAEATPEARNGALTFGTANQPYKYTPEALAAWARITAQVEGARFAFVRPEAGSASFRRHVLAAFAAEGVEEARVLFHPVRGGHMPLYDQIDISLDTFPLTGGATTVDSLWMGTPVISLVGEAFYERLSYSILSNLGLADLCAFDLAGYEATALALARDPARRADLRAGLRQRLRDSALGRADAFARDFYDLIATAVERA